MRCLKYLLLVPLLGASYAWSCDLQIKSAWIREAPPVATTLAGYAQLFNTGARPLRIVAIRSPLFSMIELHESLRENGMMQMRPVPVLEIAAQRSVVLQPEGKHLMLMNPRGPLRKNTKVAIAMQDDTGCVTTVDFVVAPAAP